MIFKCRTTRSMVAFVSIIGLLSALSVMLPARSASAATVIQNMVTSSSGSLQTRWYSLRGYGNIPKNQLNWPKRSDGCPPNATGYKALPWQPQYGPYSGDVMNLSSNCFDRYVDAGTNASDGVVSGGAWIHPDAQGLWATGLPAPAWHGAYGSWSNVMAGCSNGSLIGGNARAVWGAPGPDNSDQFYLTQTAGDIGGAWVKGLYFDQYPGGTAQSTKLYSNGVTLMRDSFNLSATDITRLGQGTTHLYFQAYADDWLQVYVNGRAVGAYSTSTVGEVSLDLTAVKSFLNAGTNWLGVMVADKGIFDTVDPGGRAAGVCYNLQYQYIPRAAFNLQPIVSHSPPGNVVEPGDSITFNYIISNPTSGASDPTNCTTYAQTFGGRHPPVGGGEVLAGPGPGTSCPIVVGPFSNPTIATETVTATTANTTICRSLYINPISLGGGTAGAEDCVFVAAKPYFRTYGGDISAGNPQPTSCSTVVKAGIVGWNREAGGGYGGAGVQYAALALDKIYDVATNLGNAASAVSTPSGLAFANTSTALPSSFGGNLGTLPCMANYYGTPSGAVLPASHPLASLNGPYTASGPVTFGNDTLAAGQKVIIYVNGDVIINGKITYLGSWTVDKIPLLEIVAKGNIYIDGGVTQLDGTYIAQGGTIYTCAAGQTPVAPTSPNFFTSCNNKLTVNGAFVAQQVQLLRTNGTVGTSSTGESSGSPNIGEVFNYGPAFWIPQPTSGPTSVDYDAITSLPPIL